MDDEKLDKLLEYIKPVNSFENSEHPTAPDYSNLDNWAAYPEKDTQQFYLPDATLTLNKNNNELRYIRDFLILQNNLNNLN